MAKFAAPWIGHWNCFTLGLPLNSSHPESSTEWHHIGLPLTLCSCSWVSVSVFIMLSKSERSWVTPSSLSALALTIDIKHTHTHTHTHQCYQLRQTCDTFVPVQNICWNHKTKSQMFNVSVTKHSVKTLTQLENATLSPVMALDGREGELNKDGDLSFAVADPEIVGGGGCGRSRGCVGRGYPIPTGEGYGEGAQPPPQNPPPVCFILTGLR